MKALASFILRGSSQAILVAVGTGVLAMILPPLSLLSGAAVGLTTLREGTRQGMIVMLGSAMFVAVLAYFSLGNALPGLVFLGVLWLPLWILGWLLRETRSLALATLVAGGFGVFGVLVSYLLLGDASAWWEQTLLTIFQPAMEAGGPLANRERVVSMLADIARIMTGILAAGIVLNVLMCLYLARAWQAQLFNPGGFRSEFYTLELGRGVALATLVIIVLSMLPLADVAHLATEVMLVLLGLYVVQGLALIHAIVALRGLRGAWLVVLYLVMFFVLPQLMVLVAVVGLIDTWVDFRQRMSTPG
jgi:uncharacterized protein YybS (DUF2232 family)